MKKIFFIAKHLFALFVALTIAIVVAVGFSYTFISSKDELKDISYADSSSSDVTGYKYAIQKGNLEKSLNFPASLIHGQVHEFTFANTAIFEWEVLDSVYKNQVLYADNGISVTLDYDCRIIEIGKDDAEISIKVIEVGEDVIVFDVPSIFEIDILLSSFLRIKSGGFVQQVEIAQTTEGFFTKTYTTKAGDYSNIYGKGVEIVFVQQVLQNATYISNEDLTKQKRIDDMHYVFSLCNTHIGAIPIYYEKIVEVIRFDNEYSIITSDNIFTYEMVRANADRFQ